MGKIFIYGVVEMNWKHPRHETKVICIDHSDLNFEEFFGCFVDVALLFYSKVSLYLH